MSTPKKVNGRIIVDPFAAGSKILDSLELNINRHYKSNPVPEKLAFTGFEYMGVDHERIENVEAFPHTKLLDIFDAKTASVLKDANFIGTDHVVEQNVF
ncbi:hypothetical protein CYMTET_11581 [Cymbomonas tetramitiformis]|uniref:Uncharacterized protein n=1 Tax=Cymbomonas tetramitiformis TaxID=36881 RepID=A0AAE0GCI9_9CHLO|nr:hypothetical protein CYMTET_16307 [Cymbomonas tetramitiformis]KAK3280583.1 hypothetical protein CYMTET_11581 [Cymbomonas tetramitiformis]